MPPAGQRFYGLENGREREKSREEKEVHIYVTINLEVERGREIDRESYKSMHIELSMGRDSEETLRENKVK